MPLEDPNVPYQEPPSMRDKPVGSGLYCFLDTSRPCEVECMAYLRNCPEGPDYEGAQWSKCILLVNAHKLGKHAVALAGQGDSLLKHLRIKSADAARSTQPLPPPVR